MASSTADIEAPVVPEVLEEDEPQRAREPQRLQEEMRHTAPAPADEEVGQEAPKGTASNGIAQVVPEDGIDNSTASGKRRFPWWQLLLSLAAIACWCLVLALLMEPHERGLGFETAWKEGQLWAFLLGLLIAFQGLGKLVNPLPYFDDIEPFRVPLPAWLIGGFFLLVELYTGPALCMGALHADFGALYTLAAVGAILDILAYFSLSLEAYLRGFAFTWRLKCSREDGQCIRNCTCFGIYGAQKLSLWVLLQDVIVAAETAFVANRIFSNSTLLS